MKDERLAVLYYSHRDIPKIGEVCRRMIDDAAAFAGVEVLAITPYPVPDCPDWRHVEFAKTDEKARQAGHLDGYRRLLRGCEETDAAAVAVVEHDVAYPLDYFKGAKRAAARADGFQPFVYNANVVRLSSKGFFLWPNMGGLTVVTSNLVANRERLADELRARIAHLEAGGRIVWGEPGRYWEGFNAGAEAGIWRSLQPSVDIRYGKNLTGDREPQDGRYYPRAGNWELATMAELLGLGGN